VRSARPGFSQKAVLRLDPSQRASGIASLVMAVLFGAVAVGAFRWNDLSWTEPIRAHGDIDQGVLNIVAAVAGLLSLLAFIAGLVALRRHRFTETVEQLSDDPRVGTRRPGRPLPPPSQQLPRVPAAAGGPTRAQVIPPLHIEFRPAKRFDKVCDARRVTLDQNVVGRRPLAIVYLRLFENQSRIRTFLEGAWREFGYVHFLRSADSVSRSEYRAAETAGDVGSLFVSDAESMIARLGGAPLEPLPEGRHKLTGLAPESIRVRDKYGSYPARGLLCHGAFWQRAVDLLLDRADLVVLDLSGLTDRNEGTVYELHRVIDCYPVERVVFLADPHSKGKYLAVQVQQAWSEMVTGSPNGGMQPRSVMIVETDFFHTRSSSNNTSFSSTSLETNPKHIRQLANALQTRVDALRPGRM